MGNFRPQCPLTQRRQRTSATTPPQLQRLRPPPHLNSVWRAAMSLGCDGRLCLLACFLFIHVCALGVRQAPSPSPRSHSFPASWRGALHPPAECSPERICFRRCNKLRSGPSWASRRRVISRPDSKLRFSWRPARPVCVLHAREPGRHCAALPLPRAAVQTRFPLVRGSAVRVRTCFSAGRPVLSVAFKPPASLLPSLVWRAPLGLGAPRELALGAVGG